MSREEIEKVIKEAVALAVPAAVKDAVKCELGEYKIPKEQHFKDHLWIDELRTWQGQIRNSVIKAVVGMVIAAAGALIFYGFLFFGGKK